MKEKSLWNVLLIMLLFVCFSWACNSPTPEPDGPDVIPLDGRGGGVIAYCYQPPTGAQLHRIHLINADGSADQQVGNASIGLNHHDWSPDGRRLALVGYLGGTPETWSIHVMNADGSGLTRLTQAGGVWDSEPAWSPDGTRIAFTRIYPAQNNRNELWLMDGNGANAHWLGLEGFAAKWSPDGSRFIYSSGYVGNSPLYTCLIDGSDVRQLTTAGSEEYFPSWSPDGSRIVFQSNRDGGMSEIYVMNADGSQPRRLTVNNAGDFNPRWSPDGSLIAFGSDVSAAEHWEVYIMNADGSNIRRVTNSPGNYTSINPAWKPIL